MKWSKGAEEAVSRVSFFVRKRVRRRVEEEAAKCGAKQVSLHHVRTCQKRFLNRMEEEVKGYQVETCFGSSGCPNRTVVDEGFLGKLETLLSSRDLRYFLKERVKGPLKMHHEFRLSVSDCPNACSRPQIVDVGLIGACLPEMSEEACSECGACVATCKENAIALEHGRPVMNASKCLFCAQCVRVCPTGTLKEGKRGYRILVGGKLGRHPRLAQGAARDPFTAGDSQNRRKMHRGFSEAVCRRRAFRRDPGACGKGAAGNTYDSLSPSLAKAPNGT